MTFSKPIDPSRFTDSALSLTLNGGGNLITPAVTISLVSGSTYQIAGLAALETGNGTYTLTVNGADISDLAGNIGVNACRPRGPSTPRPRPRRRTWPSRPTPAPLPA